MKLSNLLIASSTCLFLFACSATGPKFSPAQVKKPNDSLLYVYRSDAFCLGGRAPDIHVNSKKVGVLSNNGYLYLDISPGPHLIEAKGLFDLPSTALTLNTEPNKSYYIKWIPECGFFTWKLKLVEIPEKIALKDIVNSQAVE